MAMGPERLVLILVKMAVEEIDWSRENRDVNPYYLAGRLQFQDFLDPALVEPADGNVVAADADLCGAEGMDFSPHHHVGAMNADESVGRQQLLQGSDTLLYQQGPVAFEVEHHIFFAALEEKDVIDQHLHHLLVDPEIQERVFAAVVFAGAVCKRPFIG